MTMEELEARVKVLEEALTAQRASTQPGGYYVSKYSGEEMDALLDKIKEMGV